MLAARERTALLVAVAGDLDVARVDDVMRPPLAVAERPRVDRVAAVETTVAGRVEDDDERVILEFRAGGETSAVSEEQSNMQS